MFTFSQRIGKKPIRSSFQRDDLDHETRTDIWNFLFAELVEFHQRQPSGDPYRKITTNVWVSVFKKPRDEEPNENRVWGLVKDQILNGEWFEVLDLAEAFVRLLTSSGSWSSEDFAKSAAEGFNRIFESDLVGFRFFGVTLVPIENEIEISSINQGLKDSEIVPGSNKHLNRALELLSDRKNPDYANSIKESISAVESLLKQLTGIGTLGKALDSLNKTGLAVHPSLLGAWSKMYGWTSAADGIRHGGVNPPGENQALAKYMLAASSAFISFVIEEVRIKNPKLVKQIQN